MHIYKKFAVLTIALAILMGGLLIMSQPAKAASMECIHMGHKIVCTVHGVSQVDADDWGFSGFSPSRYTTTGNSIQFRSPGCGFYTVNASVNGSFYYQHSYDWDGWDLFCN